MHVPPTIGNVHAQHTNVGKVPQSHFHNSHRTPRSMHHKPPRPPPTHGKVLLGPKAGCGVVGFFRNMIGQGWAACCGQSGDNLMAGRPGMIQGVQRSPWHRLQGQQQETRQHAIDVVANTRF